jgi:hypothetical protein
MKINNDLLRNLIKECMHDMGMPVSNFSPPAILPASPMQSGMHNPDPDGYEGRMAKANLFKVAEYAMELHNLIQDGENLEPWVQEKIAVASSMLDSVAHHMKYDKMRGPQKSMPMPVAKVISIGD